MRLLLPREGVAVTRPAREGCRDVQAAGCPERLDLTFLWWVWRYPIDSRPRLEAALDRYRANLRVIELTSSAQVEAFLRAAGE